MKSARHLAAGFSLLEILIVVGLLGIVALGSITVITNMNRATKGVQFAGEVNSFGDDVRGLLTPLNVCARNFGSTRPSGALNPNVTMSLTTLTNAAGAVVIDTAAGVEYGNGMIHVDSIEFGRPGTFAGPHPSAGPFQVRLRLRYSAAADVLGNQKSLRDFNIWAMTDAAGNVSTCSIGPLSPFSGELLADNGYIVFPNGLVMQWGQATSNSNGLRTINFPIAFPNRAFSITVSGTIDTGDDSKDNWPTLYNHPGSTTRTSFQVFSANGANDPIAWMAIGN